MSLNGNLEAFPLAEVLRLLVRAGKSGCLRVDARGMQGKIYFDEGGLSYATIRSDEDLRVDLLNAGLVQEPDWLMVEQRHKSIPEVLAPGRAPAELHEFVAEQITDVIFRLRRGGSGTFDFGEDVMPRYATGQRVTVEECIGEADRRIAQWAEIEEVIPGTNFRLRMADQLPVARDITVTADTWRLLAAMEGVATIEQITERLGATDFQIAQAMAALVRAGLVVLVDQLPEARYGYGHPVDRPVSTEEPEVPPAGISLAPEPSGSAGNGYGSEPGEPSGELESGFDIGLQPVADPVEEVEEVEDEDDSDFLASVISEMRGESAGDEEEDHQDEPGEAETADDEPESLMAALRRRRGLGSLSRELSDLTD